MIGRQHQVFKLMSNANKRINKLSTRAFSSEIATQGSGPASAKGIQTLWQYSSAAAEKAAAKEQSEAAYLDTLKEYSSKPGAYSKLSETGSSDHLKQIRKRINKIVEQEIGLVEFKN